MNQSNSSHSSFIVNHMKMLHLSASVNNIQEWVDSLNPSHLAPRLPLVYGFGTVFLQRGHQFSALNVSVPLLETIAAPPFKYIYSDSEWVKALSEVDGAFLWAREGINAIAKQMCLKPPQRKVILGSYVWDLNTLPKQQKMLGIATRISASFAKALVVMTEEQSELAKKTVPSYVPVIKFICGIDTDFYSSPSHWSDVPQFYHSIVEKLLASPYVIMPGSQQRYDDELLNMVTQSDFKLVRIARYDRAKSIMFHEQIKKRELSERIFFFENIDYAFLRFLFQHATAYAGLVNSNWQPAGWTVTCEALATGLPVVLYEGLVSRELKFLGASEFLQTVPMGEIDLFKKKLEFFISNPVDSQQKKKIQEFADQQLNLGKTGVRFAQDIENLVFNIYD